MKKLSLLLLALLFSQSLSAYLDWQAVKGGDFVVFYPPGYEQRAVRLLSDIEYYKFIPEGIVGNTGHGLPFVLEDWGQYVNGMTDPVTYRITIINTPTEDVDWFSLVAVHEYTHLVQMTRSSGIPALAQFIFGNAACPQLEAPYWTFEAITVYNESKISKFMGRDNDGGYEQYMDMRAAEGTFPSLTEATYMPFEMPSGEIPYLYGSQFLKFLADTYGEDKLKKFYDSYGGSIASYLSPVFPWLGIDRTYDEVFGGTTETLWQKWEEYVKARAKDYKQEGENISKEGWLEGTPVIYEGVLYYTRSIFEKTGTFDYWAHYDMLSFDLKTGEKKVVATSNNGFTTAPSFYNGKVYYTVNEIEPGHANESNLSYGTTTVLYEKDLKTGAEKELLTDDIRGFCVTKDGLVIYSADNRLSATSRMMEYDIASGEKRFLWDADMLVLELSAGDGVLACSASKDMESNAGLYMLDIKEKKFTPVAVTPYYESQPRIYGDKLFFRANYGKAFSAYCYDMKAKKVFRLTENGVASSPAFDAASGEIYFVGLNTKGFDIYKEKASFKDFNLPQDADDYRPAPLLDASKTSKGSYLDNLATLYPKVRLPILYADDMSNITAGLGFYGSDAMNDLTYDAVATYNTSLSRMQFNVQASSYMLSPLIIGFAAENYTYLDGSLQAGLTVPLNRSMRPGLSSAYINLFYRAFDGLDRRQFVPGAGVDFTWPSTTLSAYASRIFEGKWLGSTLASRQGVSGGISLAQYMPDTKVLLRGSVIYDPDNTDNVVGRARGYTYDPAGNVGGRLMLDITRPLIQIRKGTWNPVSVYFEDLCGGVFADAAFANDTQLSCGVELKLETRFFFLLGTEIGVRESINKDGKFKTDLLLMMPGAVF